MCCFPLHIIYLPQLLFARFIKGNKNIITKNKGVKKKCGKLELFQYEEIKM